MITQVQVVGFAEESEVVVEWNFGVQGGWYVGVMELHFFDYSIGRLFRLLYNIDKFGRFFAVDEFEII